MKTLRDLATVQTLYILPRVYASNVYYTLVNEDTKVSVTAKKNEGIEALQLYYSADTDFEIEVGPVAVRENLRQQRVFVA